MVDATQSSYPAVLTIPDDNKVANWRPLAHWIMVIPHYIVSYVLQIVSQVLALVSWFIIVITGKLPEGIANFQIMATRYNTRVFGWFIGMTEEYPPFTFDAVQDDPGDHAIGVSINPELEDRNRLTVLLRIFWLIPVMVVGIVWAIIAEIIAFLAWFAVLFTGRYPNGMRNFMIGAGRFFLRVTAYGLLLTDEYPPFNTNE